MHLFLHSYLTFFFFVENILMTVCGNSCCGSLRNDFEHLSSEDCSLILPYLLKLCQVTYCFSP